MLPDLPSLKQDLFELYLKYLQKRMNENLGVFQQAQKYTCYEGDCLKTVRADDSIEESEFKRSSAFLTLQSHEVATLTPQRRVELLDELARELGEDISRNLFSSLSQTLEDAGQTVDLKGKDFGAEGLLAVLQALQLDFDVQGRHAPLTLVTGTYNAEELRNAFSRLADDPQMLAKYDELISNKKVEWRAREAARKLVG